jgi:septum formation protein
MTIYLSSKSPRRRELLTQMGVQFELLLLDVPEEIAPNETIEIYSQRVTREKLSAAWEKMMLDKLPVLPILCADTEVVIDEDILGKPKDAQDAFAMIKRYSGRSHKVISSVGLKYTNYEKLLTNVTIVHFAHIPDEAIHHYIATGDYKDKSGGYGIQSYLGQFISGIDGCFYSVMGLPLNSVRELLLDLNRACPHHF